MSTPGEFGQVIGEVIDERDVIPADRGGGPTSVERELEQTRAERAAAREAEQAARWEAGCRREGLLPLLDVVEKRLQALPAVLHDIARRRALLPRVIALAQDVLDAQLPAELTRRIHEVHRALQAEALLVGNAPAARALVAQVRTLDPNEFERVWQDAHGYNHSFNPGLFSNLRQQLGWHVAPLPAPSAEACTRDLEALEAEVLAAIRTGGEGRPRAADSGRRHTRKGSRHA